MKKCLKAAGIILLILLLIAGAYVAYVFASYYRINDKVAVEPENRCTGEIETGERKKLVSWNIGFGAYEDDYGFFMDGGTESRAWSRERLEKNIDNISDRLISFRSDLVFLQEVDTDSTRSYHMNEVKRIEKRLCEGGCEYSDVFAMNWDSPYLFYPVTCPIGSIESGILTMADYEVKSALRRSLPIETGVSKLVDLDRCYSVSRIPVSGGGELCLFNFHLSAYSSDETVVPRQMKMMLSDMQDEYEKGNYVIAGGDFNQDLLGDSSRYFGVSGKEFTWAKPVDTKLFDGLDLRLAVPFDEADPVPSGRNADGPVNPEQFMVTIDGFILSDNVREESADVIDTGFKYSDHNPVCLEFVLEER